MDNEQSPLADVPNAFVGADGQLVQLDSRTAEPSSSGSDTACRQNITSGSFTPVCPASLTKR